VGVRTVVTERFATTKLHVSGFEVYLTGAKTPRSLRVYMTISPAGTHENITDAQALGHELDAFSQALSMALHGGLPLRAAVARVESSINRQTHISTHPPEYIDTLNRILKAACDWLLQEFQKGERSTDD